MGVLRPPVAFVFVSNILRLLKFLRLYPGNGMGSAINDIHFKNHVVGRAHHTHIALVAMLMCFTGMKNRFQKKRLVCYFGISLSKQRLDICGVITKGEISPKQPCSCRKAVPQNTPRAPGAPSTAKNGDKAMKWTGFGTRYWTLEIWHGVPLQGTNPYPTEKGRFLTQKCLGIC